MAKAKTLSYQQILKALQQKSYSPVYLLHGEESFYIDQLTNYIETHVLDEGTKAFNQTVLYGKDIDYKAVLDSARRYPVLSDKQVVIIKEAQELKTIDKLEPYFQNPLESTILVLAHKHKKLDKRKKFAKTLSKSKKACLFESKKLYDKQVPNWISNYLKDKGVGIRPAASQLLAEYLGSDLSKIANELDKLLLNLPKGASVDKQLIQKNIGISKDFNVFELQNALGRRDGFKSFLIVKYFIANPKNHPLPMITATLYNFFSKVYVCQTMLRSNDETIAKAIGANKFFVKDYRSAAKAYNRPQLERVFHLLKEYDLRSKGVNNVNNSTGELLREMIVQILAD
jgi:DNA polymerase-3 subunit delta